MPPFDFAKARGYLQAFAPDVCTSIEVLDGNLRQVPLESRLGDVSVELPFGVYVVRFRQGNSITEKLAVLTPADPRVEVHLDATELPAFSCAAPIVNTATTHEWQAEPAQKLSQAAPVPPPRGHQGGSHLLLFLRNPFRPGELPSGVTLHDLQGEALFDLSKTNDRDEKQQWMGAHLNLDPGAYRLRRSGPREIFTEQIVFTRAGWQTQVFLMARDTGSGPQEVTRTSILMARPNVGFAPECEDFRWTESALRALKRKGNIPGAARSEMLGAKFENPMLGIYAGLLHLRRETIDPSLLREVFENLFQLVGPLPDVLSIGWGLALRHEPARQDANWTARLRNPAAMATPPLLRESWEHLVRASSGEVDLVSEGSLSDRIGARLVSGTPWVSWLGDLPRVVAPVLRSGVTRTAGGDEGWLKGLVMKFLPSPLLVGVSKFTLHGGLPVLANLFAQHPDVRFWLQSRRFDDIERSVAYWVQPTLDPRLSFLLESDPEVAHAMSESALARANDETALLTELNLSATTALHAGWGLFTKLFAQPVLPNDGMVNAFVQEESRGNKALANVLRELQKAPSRFRHPASGRTLNLLELVYLHYRGSPADGFNVRAPVAQIAEHLADAGFLFDQRKPVDLDLTLSNVEAGQHVIESLELAQIEGRWRASMELWPLHVFPKQYTRGNLLPQSAPAQIRVEYVTLRDSITVTGDRAASYALIKLIPTGAGSTTRSTSLNLALVLDVSGSMYEEDGTNIPRLKRIQDAAIAAIQKLKPDDTMTIVAFAHNARTLLPPTKISEKDKIEDVIRNIDRFDVDPGGTAMNDGMRLALDEIERLSGPGQLSQILVLTDGETSGEQDCRALAERAHQSKIHLTLMGVGLDWKASLIKDLAKISAGKWYYIDVNDAAEAERVLVEEFAQLAAAAFMNVEMHLRPMKDIAVKRVRQVVPEIKEMQTTEPEERHLVAQLGTLPMNQSSRYVLDLSLPKRPDGKYVIAQIEITYNLGLGTRASSGPIPLEMTYTAAGSGTINAEVMKHIDEVQIFELNSNLQKAIATDNSEVVKKVAEQIEQTGQLMGSHAAKKTMLAQQVLQELHARGSVSKKTQLAMEDQARTAEEVTVAE